MKSSKPAIVVSVQQLVQDFFEKHLTTERNVSDNTVVSYRDGLKLFLHHAAERMGCDVDQLDHAILDVDVVRSFLDSLKRERKCGARTRNQRLAAIKAFARYVGSVAPEHLERCRRIRELALARIDQPEIQYLDDDEVLELVKAIDPASQARDTALLLLFYNTGARVQEIVNLDVGDIRLDPVPVVTLTGKGGKQRTCPLWTRTVDALKQWLKERGDAGKPLFLNAQGRRLSRSGVAYILRKLAERAGLTPRHAKRVTPHVIRHTTAMHLLQASFTGSSGRRRLGVGRPRGERRHPARRGRPSPRPEPRASAKRAWVHEAAVNLEEDANPRPPRTAVPEPAGDGSASALLPSLGRLRSCRGPSSSSRPSQSALPKLENVD